MKKISKIIFRKYFTSFACLLIMLIGCKRFIEIDAPKNSLNAQNAFANDATAIAVVTGLYTNLSADNINGIPSIGAGLPLMSVYPSLSADELTLLPGANNAELLGYYQNNLVAGNVQATNFWVRSYNQLFVINTAIEGLNNSTSITPVVKNQLLGEAYFMRALYYFYLVNLYGDVPIIISTDYSSTSLQPRNAVSEVYEQIKSDLIKSQSLISEKFLDGTLFKTTLERVRPNKSAATALLARVYLYMKDYPNAEIEAGKIINNTLFGLTSINSVFLKNSRETIWALQPVGIGPSQNTGEGILFNLPPTGPDGFTFPVYLSKELKESFEAGDQRLVNWIGMQDISGEPYFFPNKYKIGAEDTSPQEYSIVLRVAEQYLIRAEALIQQGKVSQGIADINLLRHRATDLAANANLQLKQLSSSISKDSALIAVAHERQVELFTEWGHRWLDLKRTNTISLVMPGITIKKGGIWKSNSALYPLPFRQIQTNPNLNQNPGY
ncbi:RagB/SusD family nutrient uptake outer membrane protein [Pedobacter sp. PWIIR3]